MPNVIETIKKEGVVYDIRDAQALHEEDVATVATTGSYYDLVDRPNIDLETIATRDYVSNAIANGKYGLASKEYVDEAIKDAGISGGGSGADMSVSGTKLVIGGSK